jgi:putative ABC transport system permease protein
MGWLRRNRSERDWERELRADLELEAAEQRANGLTPEEAHYAAQRAFGNTTIISEETREMWGYRWFDRLLNDLRYGCRTLKNNPGFAAVAILTAALGIGANTSIFSIVNAVLLRPLPYPDAGRLVSPANVAKDNFMGLAVGDFQYAAWRDQPKIFDGVAAYAGRPFTITGNGEPEKLKAQVVTPGFLRVLKIAPVIGRDFIDTDAAMRGGQVALISHSLWMKRFGGDASILGKSMTLDGKPYSIAGVLPRDFEFPGSADVSLLLAMSEPAPQPSGAIYFYNVIARMKRGIALDRAERDLTLINQRLESAYPQKFSQSRSTAQVRVVGLHERLVGNVQPALLVLAGAVALVLLIVCVNISNLLLARALARQREIAVRIALGAGRARVLRQLLTEGMLLACLGGLAGLAVAFGGVKLLRAIAPAGVPHIEAAHIGSAVLAFNIAIAVLCGILFGLAPMRSASAIDPEAALKQTARFATGTRRHRRLENLLIVSETAFALILLAGAGLLIRTFAGLTAIAPGFHPDHVVTAQISLPYWKYRDAERQRQFLDALLEKARSAPGVDAAGAVAAPPYSGFMMTSALRIEGKPAPDPRAMMTQDQNVAANYSAGDYFKAMGIPILEGRALDSSDVPGRPAVAVVNEVLAHRYFPDGKAIGSRIKLNGVTDWLTIVGVAGNVKQGGLASETRAEMFQSASQTESPGSAATLIIRSTADARVLAPWLNAQIAGLDKDVPPPEIVTMRETMASLVASQEFVMRLLALFAGIAITLAGIGIYSVMVYSVERRAHEIGIRLALGAQPAHIIGMVIGRGLRVSMAGSALGIAGGLALTRYLKSLLYGVTPHDPMTLAAGSILVLAAALVASYFPARRAVKQDAIASLREE